MGIADDRIFFRLHAFHLEPGAAAPFLVGRYGLFADDAFEPGAAGLRSRMDAIALQMLGVAQWRGGIPQQALQHLLSLQLGLAAQILAVEPQQVKQHDRQAWPPVLAERLLQLAEAAAAIGIQGDQLAVKDAAVAGQLAHRCCGRTKLLAPVLVSARGDAHRFAVAP